MLAFLLITSGVVWTIVAFLVVTRRASYATLRRVEALAVTPIEALEDGVLAAVEGVAKAEPPVIDPASGDGVVYVEARVLTAGASGAREADATVERGTELRLVNDDAIAEVELRGAQIEVGRAAPVHADGMPDEAMRAVMTAAGAEIPAEPVRGAKYELERRVLPLGTAVTVVGVPTISELPGGVHRGAPRRVRFGSARGMLVVTTEGLDAAKAQERAAYDAGGAAIRLFAGLGVIALAIAAWVALAG